LKLAEIESLFYNRYRDPNKKKEPWDMRDFAPWLPEPPQKEPATMTDDEIARIDREAFGVI